MPRTSIYVAVAFVVVAPAARPSWADVVAVEVFAGKHDRAGAPVSVKLPRSLSGHKDFSLTRSDNKKNIPVQRTLGAAPQLVWLLDEPLAAGKSRRYRLAPRKPSPQSSGGVAVDDNGKRLLISVAGKPVLAYNTAVVRSPNRDEPYYDRSGYLHPLYNPRGQVITDDFAPDHPHQHGIMFPWTKTSFEQRAINFWDQKGGKGKIEHSSVNAFGGGGVFGELVVRLNHLDMTTRDKPKPVLAETWRVRVYNLSNVFLFDLESQQKCVGHPLHIQKYHYGGLAIRGRRNWLKPGRGDFFTSEGKTRKDGNHTRPRWCDIHGDVDGKETGVTIFCHPGNFRAPQPVRLHPNKPYFCFAPMVLGEFRIEPNKPYVSRYRFYVHDGQLDAKAAERHWQDYADPPRVRLSGGAKSLPRE